MTTFSYHSKMNEYIFSFLTTVSIIGSIGNSIVAFVYWRKKDKQTSTFFILILAFSDLTVCSVLIPFTIYMEKLNFETSNIYFCKAFFFLTTTTVPASSLLMTVIAFDRYFCICMVSKNIMTLPKAKLLVLIVVAISGLLGVIPVLGAVILNNVPNGNHTIGNRTIEAYTNANFNESYFNNNTILNGSSSNGALICANDSGPFGFLIMPFKKFYDLIFFASAITISILYVLIYKEIYTRRKIKRERRQELLYSGMIHGAEFDSSVYINSALKKRLQFDIDSMARNSSASNHRASNKIDIVIEYSERNETNKSKKNCFIYLIDRLSNICKDNAKLKGFYFLFQFLYFFIIYTNENTNSPNASFYS
jgi:hypothetical protein